MRDLDINEVAKRANVPASTLRFYEEKGLIASVGRRGLRAPVRCRRAGTARAHRVGARSRVLARRDGGHVHARRASRTSTVSCWLHKAD